MKHLLILTAFAGLATPALAAPCRDAKGHFIKCATSATTTTTTSVKKDSKGRCHGAGGKFVKCSA